MEKFEKRNPTDLPVSLQLFGANGLPGMFTKVPRRILHEDDENLPVDNYRLEYVAARFARVESLLDIRDSKFHPNILKTIRKINGSQSYLVLAWRMEYANG